jgi:hypothetical protein
MTMAATGRGDLTPRQWQLALKGALAAFLAMGVYAVVPESLRVRDQAFYLLYGIARSVLPSEQSSRTAFRDRITGTLFGGAVVAPLTLVARGWLAVGVGYPLVQLVANRLRLGPGLRTNAITMVFLLMLIPTYGETGFTYTLHRVGWHILGLSIGIVVERLFWPEDAEAERRRLRGLLEARLKPLTAEVALYRRYRQLGPGAADSRRSGPLLEEAIVHGMARLRAALLPWQDERWQAGLDGRDRDGLRQALEALAALEGAPAAAEGGGDGG